MEKINILGVNITNLTRIEALETIQKFIEYSQKQSLVVTPNPEIILRTTTTKHDEELFYILNRADISLPDGIALKFAGWLLGKKIKRVTGADLLVDILALARKKRYKVAIFNWIGGLSKAVEIQSAINNQFPGLAVLVKDIERNGSPDFSEVNQFAPEIVFCALGAPYQEKFIFHNLANIKSAKIGMAVGGSFDYLTKKIKRAPRRMRQIGLEWLWRLVKQPKRWPRIFNAIVVFPYRFFLWRYVFPHLHRPNVACLLYKQVDGQYKILITERIDDHGHWQLPQGGTDGEDLATAGSRELREELNTDKFRAVGSFRNLHVYEFASRMKKFNVPVRNARGYKGQKQGLFIAEFIGQDSDIKINFWEHRNWQWVEADKFLQAISPIRREAGEIYLKKFWETVRK